MNLLPTFLQGCLLGLFIIFLGSPTALIAQVVKDTQITFELLSQESLTSSPPTLFQPPPSSSLPSAPHIERGAAPPVQPPPASVMLPYQLPHLQSEDGSTILQYGDRTSAISPNQTDFFWFDAQGKPNGQLIGIFDPHTLFAMSPDGYVAIVGKKSPTAVTVSWELYSPKGQVLWGATLPPDIVIPADPQIATGGRWASIIVRRHSDRSASYSLFIHEGLPSGPHAIPWNGVPQKMVFLDGTDRLFIQGKTNFGLIDLPNQKLLWERSEALRLLSPNGLKLDPDGQRLFAIVADWKGRIQKDYAARLTALKLSNGTLVGETSLPRRYRASSAIRLQQRQPDQLQISTPRQNLIYRFQEMP